MHDIFEATESQVRSYCRSFPAIFTKAAGHELVTEDGRRIVDLLMGCGALNYGHNNPIMKNAVLDYLRDDGVIQAMDLHTEAKDEFLRRFKRIVLDRIGLQHRMMFTGPTGTNAVEAALKLARKVTGRSTVVAFTGGFHGMTLGALSATSNRNSRPHPRISCPIWSVYPMMAICPETVSIFWNMRSPIPAAASTRPPVSSLKPFRAKVAYAQHPARGCAG